jgi:hypothetical protein
MMMRAMLQYPLPLFAALCLAIAAAPAAADSCAGSGNAAIVWTTPEARFDDNGDGTLTDALTGLMWMRCALGQTWTDGACTGNAVLHDWQGALLAADGFGFAGFADWRLPNIKEFNAIVEQRCRNPAANATLFPSTASEPFWTASPFAPNANYAWTIDFKNGIDTIKTKHNPLRVRLVRDAP